MIVLNEFEFFVQVEVSNELTSKFLTYFRGDRMHSMETDSIINEKNASKGILLHIIDFYLNFNERPQFFILGHRSLSLSLATQLLLHHKNSACCILNQLLGANGT